ncbi:hypothetical protein [Paenibacillus eucommiae]|uniref:Uncharacterized protein n=1 Tax=Paenibacillus eucommiae TaxID=1355755 RepID=A0ABS4J4I5_9BACL|nr:hypothetical protein [Paenibacillus eucommiae]MBP1994743.1 hypothetical protein [Paenibacillus eucommiae]
MSEVNYSILDMDEYLILLKAAEAEESFPQLIYDFSSRHPSLKIHEIFKLAAEKLEKLLQIQALEIVKINYHPWHDKGRTEHLPAELALIMLHKPELWDRENEEAYRMLTTDAGHSLLDQYELMVN